MITKQKLFKLWLLAVMFLTVSTTATWCAIEKEREQKRKQYEKPISPYFCMEGKRRKELRNQSGIVFGYATLKEKCKPSDPRVKADYD